MNETRILLSSKLSLKEQLFKHISAYDIYCNLLGKEVEVGKIMLSPIRRDKRPTFIFFIPEDKNEVYFKDFAWIGGDVLKFIKYYALHNESINIENDNQALRYINRKLGLGMFGTTKTTADLIHVDVDESFYTTKRIIKFKSRDFTDRDIAYWKQYHISKKILKHFNVRSVHKLLDTDDIVLHTYSTLKIVFAYVIFNKVKLYRPEDKPEYKWRNTCPGYYLQGLEQLKKQKVKKKKLIITKSLKDVMVFYKFVGKKYDIIAPHSETYNFKDKFLRSLYRIYDEIIVIFDFDLAGVTGANKLRKKNTDKFRVTFVSTKRIMVRGKIKTIDKDISDYVVDRDKKEIKKHLKKIGL